MKKKIRDLFKILGAYICSKIKKKYREVWLISERGTDARDNGYWMFEYLRRVHPEIEVLYCISSDSPDYEKVKKIGSVIEYGSFLHGIVYFSAKYLICSHPHLCRPEWKGSRFLENKGLISPRGKKIFLQHGIIKDMLPALTAEKMKTDIFICGAKPEYEYVLAKYGFTDEVVKYTGLARFDNLYKNLKKGESNYILLMPTWRHYLKDCNKRDFLQSVYYKKINGLLTNDNLINYLEQNNLKLIFYPHYELQKWLSYFKINSKNIILASFIEYDVQELLMGCKILITDYSSVFFDVAFMGKPVIFYQFDYEQYRSGHYSEGYFDYKNSFGPVKDNENGVIESLENDNILYDEKYVTNRLLFFELVDSQNCQRIYDSIISL